MIGLSPGSGIYVYDQHTSQALARRTATSCARFLVNCSYTNTELAGMNLTAACGNPHPQKDIISIIG